MDLWIRSQDKKTLTKIEEVAISYGGVTIRGIVDGYCRWLGKYKTEERALEVLNEIQSKIKPALYLKTDMRLSQDNLETIKEQYSKLNNMDTVICDCMFSIVPIPINNAVYEMPEE